MHSFIVIKNNFIRPFFFVSFILFRFERSTNHFISFFYLITIIYVTIIKSLQYTSNISSLSEHQPIRSTNFLVFTHYYQPRSESSIIIRILLFFPVRYQWCNQTGIWAIVHGNSISSDLYYILSIFSSEKVFSLV